MLTELGKSWKPSSELSSLATWAANFVQALCPFLDLVLDNFYQPVVCFSHDFIYFALILTKRTCLRTAEPLLTSWY